MGAQADRRDPAGPEAPSAKRLKTQFRCSKCGFITDDRAEFQQHIPQHKSDENTPQCLRCGLCFTSLLSLNRHLFIVHKVKDPVGREREEEGERKEADAGGKDRGDRLGRSGEADDHEFGLSPQEESGSPHCATTTDCRVTLSTNSDTSSLSPAVRVTPAPL